MRSRFFVVLATLGILLVLLIENNVMYPGQKRADTAVWEEQLLAVLNAAAGEADVQSSPTPLSTLVTGEVAGASTENVKRDNIQQAELLRVVDGDTLKVKIGSQTATVRFVGINAPESVAPFQPDECYGSESAQLLKNMLPVGTTLSLEPDATQADTDRYGRLLRFVFDQNGQDVGAELLSLGAAREYLYSKKPHTYRDEYVQLEEQARAANVGLWGDCSSEYGNLE